MSYVITGYDVYNGEKTTKRILKPVETLSIQDIEVSSEVRKADTGTSQRTYKRFCAL